MNRVKPEIGLAYLCDNNSMKQELTSEFTTNVEMSPNGYIQLVESGNDFFFFPFHSSLFSQMNRVKPEIGLAYLRDNNSMKQEEIEKEEIATEVDTPQGIVNFLQKRHGVFNFPKPVSRYSVTELVGCQRKSFYKQSGIEQEELLENLTVEGMWASVRGNFLHNMTYAYKWREMDMEYKVPLENGQFATLAGRLDMYDWKSKTIIDLKSTKLVKWQIKKGFLPKLEHALQLQCYDTMFSKYLPIENLNIVYVDNSDIITYKVERKDLTEWIQTRIQEIENAKVNKETPKGEPNGLCQFCKYQTKCFNEGNGIEHAPLSTPKKQEDPEND